MNCKNLKIRQKNYKRIFYCTAKKKEIDYHNCSKDCECYIDKYEQKNINHCAKLSNSHQIKNKSKKLAKLERERFSILTNDLEHCIICGAKKDHLHEVFPGAFRQRSMKEHMVLPLCTFHHTQIHSDIELSLYWKRSCQKKYEESHTRDEFIKIFGRNYL